jgi:hypothetical protein
MQLILSRTIPLLTLNPLKLTRPERSCFEMAAVSFSISRMAISRRRQKRG